MRALLAALALLRACRGLPSFTSKNPNPCAPTRTPDEQHCKSLYWVHTPKTGSTFALTLASACCNERFHNASRQRHEITLFGSRATLGDVHCAPQGAGHKELYGIEFSRVVIILREPKARLARAGAVWEMALQHIVGLCVYIYTYVHIYI